MKVQEAEFFKYVRMTDGCWLWTGPKVNGYGYLKMEGTRSTGAHRIAYERIVGPIPAGHEVHHACQVRTCVRPDHLEPLTNVEHARRTQAARGYVGPTSDLAAGGAWVGVDEIALILGVQERTVHVWQYRGALLPRDRTISGRPAWRRSVLLRWAVLTDRMSEAAAIEARMLEQLAQLDIELMGVQEIALMLAVQERTVHQWQTRKLLPARDATISGLPAWRKSTVEAWARETGRIAS